MKWLQFQRRTPGAPWMRTFFVWTICRVIVKILFKLVYRIQVSGSEHVPRTGPAIYVCSHQSHLDPMITGIPIWDRPFTPLARATLFDTWWLSLIMKMFGTIAVSQGSGRAGPMKAMLKELQVGRCVMLYPEGSRTQEGFVAPLQSGFLLLVKKSKAPIVPIAIEGAFNVWPRSQNRPNLRGRIAVRVAEPIAADVLLADGNDAALQQLRTLLETMRMELREDLQGSTRGTFPPAGPADQPYWECGTAAHDQPK